MQYSPKLKKAMQEIMAILEREDIAGAVVLHEPLFREFACKIDPSYSCAKFEQGGLFLRLRTKLHEEYGGNKELRDKAIADTANMLDHLAFGMGEFAINFIEAYELLDSKIEVAPIPMGGGSSHTQQNN